MALPLPIKYLLATVRFLVKVALATVCWALQPVMAVLSFATSLLRKPIDSHYVVRPLPDFVVVGQTTQPELDDIPTMVAEMRASYESGHSRPIAKRLEQLHALRQMFVDYEGPLLAALEADLGRPSFEGLFYDILLPIHEIDILIANLEAWMEPETVGFNLLTFPSQNHIIKEPHGVCLIIGTWNYQFMLSMVPLAGAIAGGNTVVVKPCNVSKNSANLLAELIPKYLDPAICSVVGTAMKGDRHTTAALLEHKWDHIFFTGSPMVGRIIAEAAGRQLTPCALELGGKNPVFVAADADIDLAAKRTVWGRMMNAGQQCISPDYVMCERAVLAPFLARCKHWVNELYHEGGKSSPKTNGNFGRIVGDAQMARLEGVLQSHGGKVVCGGDYDMEARYIAPTVLEVAFDSPSMEEETFAGILLVTPVDSIQEAIDYANSRPRPLSLYVFSTSTDTANRIVYNTSAGGVTVNGTLFHVAHSDMPFGGVGDSGMGGYHGKHTFDTFVHRKPVLTKSIWPDMGLLSDPFFLYPPWTDFKLKLVRAVMKIL